MIYLFRNRAFELLLMIIFLNLFFYKNIFPLIILKQMKKVSRKRISDVFQSKQNEISTDVSNGFCSPLLRNVLTLEFLDESVPEYLQMRESEVTAIKDFLFKCFSNSPPKHKVLMISGSPGNGKTMCITYILSLLKCQYLELNANITKTLKDTQQTIQSYLVQKMHRKKESSSKQKLKTIVIYIEEIEVLFKQGSVQNIEDFFENFSNQEKKLVLVGITNTINFEFKLEEKLSKKIKGMKQILFNPYQVSQMQAIMKEKVNKIKQKTNLNLDFPEKFMKFTSVKLDLYKKGDIRILIQFLKKLIYPILTQSRKEQNKSYSITIQMITQILSKVKGEKIDLIQCLPYRQKILLTIIYSYIKQTQSMEITQKVLLEEIKKFCMVIDYTYTKEMIDGLKELENYNMIRIRKTKPETKVALLVGMTDIAKVLGSEETVLKKFYEQH